MSVSILQQWLLDALSPKNVQSRNEIASEYGVHPTQIAEWKKLVMQKIPDLFASRGSEKSKSEAALIANLYQQIGQLKVELDFVKKKSQRFS